MRLPALVSYIKRKRRKRKNREKEEKEEKDDKYNTLTEYFNTTCLIYVVKGREGVRAGGGVDITYLMITEEDVRQR